MNFRIFSAEVSDFLGWILLYFSLSLATGRTVLPLRPLLEVFDLIDGSDDKSSDFNRLHYTGTGMSSTDQRVNECKDADMPYVMRSMHDVRYQQRVDINHKIALNSINVLASSLPPVNKGKRAKQFTYTSVE